MARIASVGLAFALAVAAPVARADLPPPDGQRFVSYSVKVDNLDAFKDYVVLAFPYSPSDGAPTTEVGELQNGTLTLGRRSAVPSLYAMKRSEYEAWKQTYRPSGDMNDPALEELFLKSGKVTACGVKLAPSFVLEKDDPRSGVVEAFRAEKIDDKTCQLTPVADKAAAEPTPAPMPTPESNPANTPPVEGTPPATKRGCAGCAVGGGGLGGSAAWILGALLWIERRRRLARRPSDRRSRPLEARRLRRSDPST